MKREKILSFFVTRQDKTNLLLNVTDHKKKTVTIIMCTGRKKGGKKT